MNEIRQAHAAALHADEQYMKAEQRARLAADRDHEAWRRYHTVLSEVRKSGAAIGAGLGGVL